MKKSLIVGFTCLLLVAVTGTLFYLQSQGYVESAVKKFTKKSASTNPKPTTPTPPPVAQQFIDDSAREVTTKKPNDLGEIPTGTPEVICTGKDTNDFFCYDKHYRKIVNERGVKAAFDDLKLRYTTNNYVVAQCHPLTHTIGQAATEKYKDVAEAYTLGDGFCWSGYYHGVLEGIIGNLGSEKLEDKITSICANVSKKELYSFNHYNCVHGLGHGVMAYTQNELFDALVLCDKLGTSWEKTSCYSGVFMENVMIDNKNHFTKFLKPKDPLYPCNAVKEHYKNTCYLMQSSYMLKVSNNDFTKVFDLCSTVEKAHQATCYQSLGRDASGRSSSNIPKTKATCELGKDFTQQSNCVIGAVKDIISYFHSDVQAKQFCDTLSPDIKDICHSTAKAYYSTF